jgi:PIF1-like helicase
MIDEIGFLSEEQFAQVDVALRACGDPDKFMGGFQVIIGGDFGQMPSELKWGTALQGSRMLDEFKVAELTENVRQKSDPEFFHILNDTVRNSGVTPEVAAYVSRVHNPDVTQEIVIVATRSLMDESNNAIIPPTRHLSYVCPAEDDERVYDSINVWVGMPVILTRNNKRGGYCNGDTAKVIAVDFENESFPIKVLVHRTGKEVRIPMVSRTFTYVLETKVYDPKNLSYIVDPTPECTYRYRLSKDGKLVDISKEVTYSYLPVLPAHYLSIRRVQGLTLETGILHESIINAANYREDYWINVQYVAFSRFTTLKNVNVQGLEEYFANASRTQVRQVKSRSLAKSQGFSKSSWVQVTQFLHKRWPRIF